VNVRTNSADEKRRRGGSRPGLSKVSTTHLGAAVTALIPISYIDSGGTLRRDLVFVANNRLGTVRGGVVTQPTGELDWPVGGDDILWPDGTTIDLATTVTNATLDATVRGRRVYLADTVLRTYDPVLGTVEPVLASDGTVPTAQTIVALYRDRIFLAGVTNAFYASRTGDPTDWNFGAAAEDPGAPVAGQVSLAGRVGDVVTALIPLRDQALVIATENTLWLLTGEPTNGTLRNVSDEIGIVARKAWAVTPDGLICFLSNDGLYLWTPGAGAPTRLSGERVPDELREVDTDSLTVSMAYDPTWRGFHLFLTDSTDPTPSTHWWVDVEARAVWPQRFARGHQPLAATTLTTTGLGVVVVGGRDGYLRYFADGQDDDDGLELESHLMIGPLRLSEDDVHDGMLAEIHGSIEELSEEASVTWRVVTGRSPAEAVEAALADLDDVFDGKPPTRFVASGAWLEEGRARVARPRARGPWVVIWLTSNGGWAYESVTIVAKQLGRHR
jgi:hypothetical protein